MAECAAAHNVPGGSGGCFSFPALAGALPLGPFLLFDDTAYKAPYDITSPCSALDPAAAARGFPAANCTALPGTDCHCSSWAGGQSADCPVLMYSSDLCYALANSSQASAQLLDPANASAGLSLTLSGGSSVSCGGVERTTVFDLPCDPTAVGAGPVKVEEHAVSECGYRVTWPTAATCAPVPASGCAAPPVPTPDQCVFFRRSFMCRGVRLPAFMRRGGVGRWVGGRVGA